MIHEQTGFLARPITHVPSVKVHPGAVRSEKLLDRLTLLVGSVNLMTLKVQTICPNRHRPHLRG